MMRRFSFIIICLVFSSVNHLFAKDTLSVKNSYAVINLSVANLHRTHDCSAEMVTQSILGTPIRILEKQRWYKVQLPDGYVGWTHYCSLTEMNAQQYKEWNDAAKILVTSHYGFVYSKPDFNSQVVSDVVSGAKLKYMSDYDKFYKVSYPDGRVGYISKQISSKKTDNNIEFKNLNSKIIDTALTLYGIPYLWGGTSSKGVDCSGLVSLCMTLNGVTFPRDASQQALLSERINIRSDFSNLTRGDLIFFGTQLVDRIRVVHVGIYMGDGQFIHAQGDVHISSLREGDKNYDAFNKKRLLFATSLINSCKSAKVSALNPSFHF